MVMCEAWIYMPSSVCVCVCGHSCVLLLLSLDKFVFLKKIFFNVYFYFWERARAGEGQRERERDRIRSRLQALSRQHRARRRARTHELWDRDLSWSRKLNWLSHPDAPGQICFKSLAYINTPWFDFLVELKSLQHCIKGQGQGVAFVARSFSVWGLFLRAHAGKTSLWLRNGLVMQDCGPSFPQVT